MRVEAPRFKRRHCVYSEGAKRRRVAKFNSKKNIITEEVSSDECSGFMFDELGRKPLRPEIAQYTRRTGDVPGFADHCDRGSEDGRERNREIIESREEIMKARPQRVKKASGYLDDYVK
ncbi:hypothetical protein NDU88_007474 [Pleurodeles waltl]|uniref:Uncharacterized protein n=1 Tax=Pleurodeles waltl TaxID=8319 RepID=A0AAV7QPZ8_PLEWA|nr:hypothetical protein NDU88_007474 [Pleurodeles waltl]